jgi:GNAT superfamily N-acetyltransferase
MRHGEWSAIPSWGATADATNRCGFRKSPKLHVAYWIAQDGPMTSPLLGDQIALRSATTADLDAISRITNYPPEPPMSASLGTDRASRLGDLLVRAGVTISPRQTTVAVLDDVVVGVMDAGTAYPATVTFGQVVRLLPRALAIIGPTRLRRALYGVYLRSAVQFERLPGAYPIAELYVDERWRNRGIGDRLLKHAEDLARCAASPRMCVETGITNPARRLYERNGYRVVATRVDARYERLTGSPGRVLMAKDL